MANGEKRNFGQFLNLSVLETNPNKNQNDDQKFNQFYQV